MSLSKHRCLLGVEFYELSNKFIYELRSTQKNIEYVFDLLPEFTINKNEKSNKQPMVAKYHHQFVGLFEQEEYEKFIYFDLKTVDSLLAEELSNCDAEQLFDEIDFEKLLSNFKPLNEDNFNKRTIPDVHYVIIELAYYTSYFEGDYDCDMSVKAIGYLNDELQTIYF